jgi:hypothetical protein
MPNTRTYAEILHQIFTTRFSEDELRTFCFDIEPKFATLYDTLPGSGTEAKSRELIAYYSRRMKLGDLIEKGRELRNEIDWPTLPGDASPLAGAPTVAGERLQSIPVHGYSGIWEAENRFTRWNGYRLGKNDKAYWHGRAFLILSFDGNHGSGSLLGKLYISINGYEATYASSGRINRANVTENGTLHMYAEMHSRHRISEQGEPPEAGFRRDFFGSGEYEIHLSPLQSETKVLKGKHIYRAANRVYQEAEEYFKYLGISLEAD